MPFIAIFEAPEQLPRTQGVRVIVLDVLADEVQLDADEEPYVIDSDNETIHFEYADIDAVSAEVQKYIDSEIVPKSMKNGKMPQIDLTIYRYDGRYGLSVNVQTLGQAAAGLVEDCLSHEDLDDEEEEEADGTAESN